MLINMAHSFVVIYAVLLAAFSTGLYCKYLNKDVGVELTRLDIGISMGYLYLMMGVIISSGVLPATLALMWRQQNLAAASLSPVLGLICSLIAWLVTAKKEGGDLSVASTGAK